MTEKLNIPDIDDYLDNQISTDKDIRISTSRVGQPSNHKGKTRPWRGQTRINKSVEQHTQESKEKISLSKKGKQSWNKGIPMKQESKEKISLSKKGKQSWNKGIPTREQNKTYKPIITELGVFKSVKDGVAFYKQAGIPNAEKKLTRNLKEQTNGCRYITKEEYIMLTGKDLT